MTFPSRACTANSVFDAPSTAMALFLMCVIATGASAAEEPTLPAIIVLDFENKNPVTLNTARMMQSLSLAALTEAPGVDVLSAADVKGLLALEATKQATGCDEGSSCLAAVASSLGARYVVTGDVMRIDPLLRVSLVLLDTETAQALSRHDAEGRSLQDVAKQLPAVVHNLLVPLTGAAAVDVEMPFIGRQMADPNSISAARLVGGASVAAAVVTSGVPIAMAAALMPFAGDAEYELVLFPVMAPLPFIASFIGLAVGVVASVVADMMYGEISVMRALMSGGVGWLLGVMVGVSAIVPVLLSISVSYAIFWQLYPNDDPSIDPDFILVESLFSGTVVTAHVLAGSLIIGGLTSVAHIGAIGLFPDEENAFARAEDME